jgi:sugar lactone lactonase YvrE
VNRPQQMAMDSSNNLYIADQGNGRIVKYSTTSSTVIATYLVSGPFAVALDASGNIWVGSGGTISKIAANATDGTSATNQNFTGLTNVWGIAFDSSNDLWVSDNNKNEVYEYTGTLYSTKTTVLSGLSGPGQIFFDSSANLYLAEAGINSVYKFPPSGGYQTSTAIALSNSVPGAEAVAEDASGNLFLTAFHNGDAGAGLVTEISTATASFANQNVGTTSSSISFNFDVLAGTTVGSFKVLDQGIQGLEFNYTSLGTTCTTGTYGTATACSVQATFTPEYPGVRLGAVEVLDGSGNVLATAYVKGIGLAPLAAFSPGTVSVPTITGLSPAMSGPRRPAFDAQGNLYVVELANNRLDKIAPNGAATVVLSSSTQIAGAALSEPNAVALDGAGNLYIADGLNYRVVELSAAGVASVLGNNGLSVSPIGIAVDGGGNVYVADNRNSRIVEYPYGGSAKQVSFSGVTLSGPVGLAVDGSNNIFVADNGNNRVVKIANGVASVVSTGSLTLNNPRAIAVDSPGNIYVCDVGNNRIVEIPSGGGNAVALSTGTAVTLSSPIGAAVSGAGDLYIMDSSNNRIVASSQETAPSLTFDTTAQGYQSADSPQTVTLLNLGNAPLLIAVPASGSNPIIPSGFASDASTTCPVVSSSGSAASLAANSSCALGIDFIPSVAGSNSGSAVLTDNSLNAASAQQSIALRGAGTAPDATTTALTVSAGTVLSGGTVTLTATVTDSAHGSDTPTGTVTFTDTMSNTLGNCTLSAGACTAFAETLHGAGTDTITASYGGARGFSASSGMGVVAITLNSAVGTTASYPVPVTIATAGTVASIKVVTQGATGLDFADAGSDTCVLQAYTVSQTCTVNVTFAAKYPGPRYGAVLLEDASGNLLATSYLYGVGLAPEANFSPGVESTVVSSGDSLGNPQGLALDGNGNLYTADIDSYAVLMTTPGGITTKVLDMSSASFGSSGYGTPEAVAVDGAGALYVADSNNNRILKESPKGSGYAQTVVASGLHSPGGVAADQHGNVYIANSVDNQILKETLQADGSYVQSAIVDSNVSVLGRALSTPFSVAVDGGGNVYIADTVNSRIIKESYSGGSYTPSLVADNLDRPIQVVVDGNGNVYFSNYGWNNISKGGVFKSILAGGSYGAATPIAALPNSAHIFGLAVDGGGRVYFSDVTHHNVFEEDFQTPATAAFGATVEYVLDGLHSPLRLQLYNFGNETLTFATPSSGTNGGIAGGAGSFTFDSGTSCPEITSSGSATGGTVSSLAANSSCNYEIDFTPQAIGAINGTLTLTDNNLNVASTVQTAALAGAGISPNLTLTPAAGALANGTVGANYSQAFTASAGTSPYGYTVSSGSLPPGLTLNAAGVLAGTPTAIGNYSFTVHAMDQNAATGSQTYSLTIGQATPTVSASAWPTASAITYGQTLASSTLSGGSGSVAGSFGFTAPTTTPPTGTNPQSVTFTPSDTTNYSIVVGSTSVTVNKATATVALGNLAQTYTGSPLSATATTTPSVLIVILTYNGNSTAPTAAGSYAVVATIGDSNYSGTATGTLIIGQATQAITFVQPATPVTYGVSPILLSATGGSSDSPIAFSIVSGPGSITGHTLTITGVGTVVVAANQAGDANHAPAAQVTRSVVVVAVNLNFSGTGLAFGSQPLGSTSSAQTLIITNPSVSPVTVTGIMASGDFSATSNCPTIAALGTCSINVTFTPTAAGARTGTLTVADTQSNSLQTVSLTGTGTAPGIQVSPALLNFGSQVVTTTSSAQTITILNTGTASLNLSNIVTTGDFATISNCATIPAGSYCSLTVTFTPTATGARVGTVTFTDNAGSGDQSQSVNLSGMGTVAGATLTPSALTFPGTVVGATSFVLTSTLTNTGTAPLTGISVSAVGDFTQTNACPAALAPGAACALSIQYAPTVAGSESGTVTVTDSLGTQSASLSGTGLAPGASLSTAQLVFGGQLVNTTSHAQTVVFTNTGSAPVNVASVVPTSNFTDTTNCSGSISAGASCSINIIFTPTTAGSQSGTVTVTDSVGTQVFAAQGQGVSPGLAVTPSFEIFGAQVVGTLSQAQTLTARNTGSVPLTLNPITTSSNFSESDQCPAVLQPGASCAISLSFSPAATGVISGSLVVSDASGLVSTLVTSSGQGTLPGISATPSTLSFGSLPVETTSDAQTVTVSNTGTAPLQIGAVSGTGDFAETDTCASKTIAVGSYCVINITMTPSTVGTRTGAIQINDNADGAHLIALSGMGQEMGVGIYPTSLAFGSQPFVSAAQALLTAGTALSVAITNTGNLPLQLGGLSTQGDFTETNSCDTTVAVGGSCTLTVNFVPTALGHRTGTLTITDNAGGGTQMVSLQGDGSPVGLTLLPPMLSYGVQTVGVSSQPQATTLTNNTGQSVANLQIVASGEYSETDTCGNALANAASCTLNIKTTPVTTGAITGTITVFGTLGAGGTTEVTAAFSKAHREATDNSGNSSLGVVAVTASAIPPGISLSIPVLSFSVTSVGTPSSGQTLTLQNTGTTLSLTHLQISETNAPEFPFTTTCPATLPAQSTCTITVNFTPASYGLRAGTMNITADGGIAAALPESGTAIASVSQLAFGAPPTVAIALGGNAGSPITVLERNSNGNTAATSTDAITLTVAGPAGYSRTYTAAAVAGVATFNLSSNALTTAGGYTYTAAVPSNASIKPAVAVETVSQAASAVSVTAGNNPSLLQNSVTFTATVTSTAGTPTGTVNFLDGTTPLGSSLLSGGVATFATSSLAAGSHSITATYIGDANFVAASSGTLTQAVIDFAVSAASAGGGSGTSQTVLPGGSATYSLGILPSAGTGLPAPVSFTVSGMPEGATAVVTPSSWTQLNGTSWSFPANTPLSAIAMTVQLPQAKASLNPKDLPGRKLPFALWGVLLLPFAVKMRRTGKRLSRQLSLLLLLIAVISAISGLSGCGSASGFFGQQQKTYTVTVTATAGSLSHSTTVTLTVE